MSVEFRDLLTDLLEAVDPFRDTITHILMRRKDNVVEAAARSRENSISIQAVAKKPVADYENIACLGKLPYLKTILNSDYIKGKSKKFTIDLKYDIATDNKTTALRTIKFSGGNMTAFYTPTDPFVNKLNNLPIPKITKWPVLFGIDATVINHFEQLFKIHQSAPRAGGDRDDIFQLAYNDGEVLALFGDKGHQSQVVLTTEAGTTEEIDKLSAMFSISHFRSILKFMGKKGGIAYFADKCLKIELETNNAEYAFAIYAKKLVD